ncbi:MAG: ABC transporter ATP-binding protein/permease [Treponema sp.]|nr:ABC transporter ATP-binding protein/permease [Treponema sp.]
MKGSSFFGVALRLIPMQFRAAPLHNLTLVLMQVFHALIWALNIAAIRNLFDAIAGAQAGYIDFMGCLTPLLILAGITFAQQLMNGLVNFYNSVAAGKTEGKIRTILQKKLGGLDPVLFEAPAFLDDLNKAKEGVKVFTNFCVMIIAFIFFYGLYFIFIGSYLFFLKPILLLTLMMSFIPALFAQIVRGRVFTKLEEQNAPLRRENEYYQRSLCDREYFKETRTLGAFRFFYNLYSETLLLLTGKIWQAERKTALLQLLLNISSFFGMAGSSYLLFLALMSGEISIGAFTAVFASLGMIFSIMQEVVTRDLGVMNRDIGKLKNLIMVMDMPERAGMEHNKSDDLIDFSLGIVAEDLSFRYPGREEDAVKDVSLSIAQGQTLAIVGENGAGKTTLVRLLTGLYHPRSGRVIIGGLDSRGMAGPGLFKGISAVFQKYQRYKMTLKENVFLSDTGPAPDNTVILNAVNEAGLELEDGRLKLDTMLSPEFDGIDLSGGQWQRLAIARRLYRSNGFIVLDEPTAAIDPIEETRIYRQFRQLAEGKSALLVTHRLGSARLAHSIIVMDGGRITDRGTHEELLSRPGKYANMWKAQARWYDREEQGP